MSGINAKRIFLRRPSDDRGHANHGWLDSYHTFSFASYWNPAFDDFGTLRVLNEDWVAPSRGFGTHGHANFEIFSYIIDGELTHRDSMGNEETLTRGDIQFTSAGSGIRHSEMNNNAMQPVKFLQFWVVPYKPGLGPEYKTMRFTDKEKTNALCQIISGKTEARGTPIDGTIQINQDVRVFASILEQGNTVTLDLKGRAHLHLISSRGECSLTVRGIRKDGSAEETLVQGDGLFVNDYQSLEISGLSATPSEFVIIDV